MQKKKNLESILLTKTEEVSEEEFSERPVHFILSQWHILLRLMCWHINRSWVIFLMLPHFNFTVKTSAEGGKTRGEEEMIITFSKHMQSKNPVLKASGIQMQAGCCWRQRVELRLQQAENLGKEKEIMSAIDNPAYWYEMLFLVPFNYSPWIKPVCVPLHSLKKTMTSSTEIHRCAARDASERHCLSSASKRSI